MVQHYLLTLEARDYYVHGYVMAETFDVVDATMNKMADIAEARGGLLMPVMLCTTLTDSIEKVRALLGELAPEIAEAMQAATNMHQTIVGIDKDDPINPLLMALH